MRPIDADSLKDDICKKCYSNDCKSDATDTITGCYLLETINNAPTVEAEPVKHGRWIRAEAKGYPVKRSSIWYCSECGEKIKYNDTLGRYQKTKKTVSQVNPRCRKCGARMDGGDKNA